MKAFRFEIILALVLAAAVLLFWRGQDPRKPLTAAETQKYVATIAEQFPFPTPEMRTETVARVRAFAEADDGRDFYMLNLLRFNETMHQGPALQFSGTPAEANAIYEKNVLPVALGMGSFAIFAGDALGANVLGGAPAEDDWSRIIVMHYPSRRHFLDLLTSPSYLKSAAYKSYAMHIALTPVKRELVVPDLRFLAAVGALIVFLLAALIRAHLSRNARAGGGTA